MKKTLIYIILLLGMLSCRAYTSKTQNEITNNISNETKTKNDFYYPERLKYADEIYMPQISSVQLNPTSWQFGVPAIFMNQKNTLTLSFDEFAANKKDYFFTFILCDALWNPCDMLQPEYIEGFFEDAITSFQFSMNTLVSYVHYSIDFPTENMRPIKSGNYILHVWYYDGNKKINAITKRFFVVENNITIKPAVHYATSIEMRDYQHEIDFVLSNSDTQIIDPYRNLTVVLQQNGRTDNLISDLKPSLVVGNELVYNFESGNLFDANNEFRRFDIQSLYYNSDRIASIQRRDGMIHVYLKPDFRRPYSRYVSDNDINGNWLIKNEDGKDSNTESEYVWVHFFLNYDAPISDGSIFLQGAFTQWGFDKKYKMSYDYKLGGYRDSLLLKQGYYNYQYVFLGDTKSVADASFVEGRHSEADNNYTIYVYYRERGELYDRLLGIQTINSTKK